MIMLKEMHYFGHQAHSQIRYQFYLFVCRAERDVISLSQINSLCPTTPEYATHFFCFVFLNTWREHANASQTTD